jgi:hypothetical protein
MSRLLWIAGALTSATAAAQTPAPSEQVPADDEVVLAVDDVQMPEDALSGMMDATAAPPADTSPANKVDEEPLTRETADVALTARVHAKEVKFHIVPNIEVHRFATPNGRTEWSGSRENLPQTVKAGETYKNVGAEVQILSKLGEPPQMNISTWEEQEMPTRPRSSKLKPPHAPRSPRAPQAPAASPPAEPSPNPPSKSAR